MNDFRNEMKWKSFICYILSLACLMGFLSLPATVFHLSKFWLVAVTVVCCVGIFIFSYLFLIFVCMFIIEAMNDNYTSSVWAWVTRHEKTKRMAYVIGLFFKKIFQKFTKGTYIGFKRLCLLIIVICILICSLPYFNIGESMYALPAISTLGSLVFIVKG